MKDDTAGIVTGAILAGGASSRMGRKKESILLPDGRTMIETVRDALWPLCAGIVIVGRTDELPKLPHIEDRRKDCGPLGGIETLLASNLDKQYLICPCDSPRLSAGLLRLLLTGSDARARVFRIEGEAQFRPLPACVRAAALPAATALLECGERAVASLMRELDAENVSIPQESAAALANINTPEELALFRSGSSYS